MSSTRSTPPNMVLMIDPVDVLPRKCGETSARVQSVDREGKGKRKVEEAQAKSNELPMPAVRSPVNSNTILLIQTARSKH